MKQFDPPIETRTNNELIGIVHDNAENWQQEAIERAHKELERRGITENHQIKIIKKLERQFERRERRAIIKNEELKSKGYSINEMLKIFLLAPFYASGRFIANETVFTLYKINYKRKFYQRIALLISGVLFWISVMIIFFKISDYRMQREFDRLDRLEQLEKEVQNVN